MTTIRWGAATDVGQSRERNEDSYFAGDHIFVVADGLGGHRAGEVASRIAVDELARLDESAGTNLPDALEEAILTANRVVGERAASDPATAGMGTTVTALAIDGTVGYLAHVGDSRCYLFRDGAMTLVSHDHTLVARMVSEGTITAQQAESHPQRSVLTRALGTEPHLQVDIDEIPLAPGDRLILCSDGLSSVVPEDEIAASIGAEDDPQETCFVLIDQANGKGGPDNITVVMVVVDEVSAEDGSGAAGAGPVRAQDPARREPIGDSMLPARQRRFPKRALIWSVLAIAILVGGLIGLRAWANQSWYVGLDADTVTIYRGLPTDFFVSLRSVHERTALTIDGVAPYYHQRLREGLRARDLRHARAIVDAAPRATPTASPSASPSSVPPSSPSPAGSKT